ncbi:MAG: EutN/CcmL family microcompartment protein [Planctomycetota bacterium]
MNLGRVIGTVWASRKHTGFEGLRMQLLQPLTGELKPAGGVIAACDSVGCGPGELVYYVLQYEATLPFPERPLTPIDAAIVGIVDQHDDRRDEVLADGRGVAGA